MTLLVALAGPKHSFLVADRRITCDGQIQHDEFNKVCVFFCDDAKLAIAFTGLATFDAFDSSTWIATTLSEIASQTLSVAEVLAELRVRAAATFPAIRAKSPRVAILACGYVYWGAAPEPRVYVISNLEAPDNALHNFEMSVHTPESDVAIVVAGSSKALPETVQLKLANLLRQGLPPESVLRFALLHMRAATNHHAAAGLIGEQFNAAILNATPDTVVTSTYHSSKNSRVAFGANVVVGRGLVSLGIELNGATTLAGGEIRKQDVCWCGSGALFKHCHLKKFGAVYGHAPGFRRPLPWRVEVSCPSPKPSGQRFCVTSSYA